MAVSMKSASVKAFGATPKAARSVVVRSEHKPREPVRFEDIPASQRVFTDAQWDEAINKASTGKYAATISASTSTPAAAAPAAAKVVTVGDAFAFSGPLPETANGRLAMLGFVSCMAVEFKSDLGTLEQVGFSGLPSMDLVYLILGAVGASSALGALVTGARYATGNMPAPEVEQYRRFFTLQPQELVDDAVFPTPELKYARGVELSNGRAAMLGFLAGLVMEALTGHGVIGQVVIYLKLAGLLGEKSGF